MTILSCDKIQETKVVCIRSYVVVPFSNSGYMAPEYDVFRFGKRIVDFIHPNMVQASFLMRSTGADGATTEAVVGSCWTFEIYPYWIIVCSRSKTPQTGPPCLLWLLC
ncbi:hypothetical protein AB3S75_008490 [Citrus x aurantiifolia]